MRSGMIQTTYGKLFRRLLLPFVSTCAMMLFCTGCFTRETWHNLGKTETYLPEDSLRYEISPDGSEIVFSGRQKTAHYCWPLIHCVDSNRGYSKYTWNTYKTVEKRVSLDALTEDRWRQAPKPYRENLVRFHLDVVQDPDVPRAWIKDDLTPSFETPVERIEAGNSPPEDTRHDTWFQHYVNPDETVRLRINPDDLPLLSDRRNIFLKFYKRQTDGTTGPCNTLLVCPVTQDGSRYEMLAYHGNDYFLEVFRDGILEQGSTGVAGYCWKILWMPAAVVADVIALPVYLVFPPIMMNEP
jgi:hypothetical protein